MPSNQDPAEQVRFLVCCIKHTNNGRPEFTAVAEELGIVSKAAAQKRYERLLKFYHVQSTRPPASATSTPEGTPVKRRAGPRTAAGSAKKAKKETAACKKEEEGDYDEKKPLKKEECTESDSELSGQ
ncbi:hypothetical protein AAL_02963 [Moelleriella libera RCEF 2490]|uniref:Myb-like DNA-binding domain-containing protein n=1 Tax=Moelleriella libera RCEF 2490 TaxID=1081109 RepID=A0A168E5N1_9HYPO|nr:hypothetical protein AAL_02963 [Moelleriella libera RCEF 2490]